MGIRFYCPNGHKLNVKSFLAGKRGICPHCGVRFEIPQQSVATNKIPTAVPEAPLAETIEDPFADLAPVGAGDARHVAPVQLGPAGVPAHAAAPSRGAQIPLSVGGAVSPTTNPGVQQPFVVPSPQSIAPQPFAPPKAGRKPPPLSLPAPNPIRSRKRRMRFGMCDRTPAGSLGRRPARCFGSGWTRSA